MEIVKWIRYHTVSQELRVITISIFIGTFINTAFILLFAQANTQQLTILSYFPFKGDYTDMTENWYLNIGPALISAMMFNSVYIYIDFAVNLTLKGVKRITDKGCLCCKGQTKATTI